MHTYLGIFYTYYKSWNFSDKPVKKRATRYIQNDQRLTLLKSKLRAKVDEDRCSLAYLLQFLLRASKTLKQPEYFFHQSNMHAN